MSEETIQIRRYPNRRFYDRQSRQYINLTDIEAMVKAGKNVEVRDSKTGEDLTRSILTQIILERHPERMSLFPVALLHNLLRANDAVTEFVRDSMRQSMEYWDRLKGPVPPPLASAFRPPINWMETMLKAYAERMGAAGPESAREAEPPPEPPPDEDPGLSPPPPPPEDPVAERIAQLEARLAQLENAAASKAQASNRDLVERLERRIRELEAGPEPQVNE